MTAITLPAISGPWSPSRGVGWRNGIRPGPGGQVWVDGPLDREFEHRQVGQRLVGEPIGVGERRAGQRRVGRPGAARVRSASPAVYRRRRVGAVLAAAVVVLSGRALVLGLTGAPVPATGRSAVQPVAVHTYRVAPGDTLWAIARRLQPSGDVRGLVDELATARHGRPLRAGDVITLP